MFHSEKCCSASACDSPSNIFPTSKAPLMWNPVFTLFGSTTIKNIICSKKELVCLKASMSIQEALSILSKSKIHAAPLLDENNNYHGMIDNLMLLRYIYHESREISIASKRNDLSDIPLSQDVIRKKTLDDVLGMLYTSFSSIDLTRSVNENDKVSRAARLFGKGYARLPVLDVEGNLKGIISQRDVLLFLKKHAADPQLHMLGHLTIDPEEVDEVVAIDGDKSLSQCLELMFQSGVSCLAVRCAQTGKLIGHFSATDLKTFGSTADFPSSDLTIVEYLCKYSQSSLQPIVISSGASMMDVVDELCASSVRHLWGIDREMHARMCIGMKDVFSKLCEFRLLRDTNTTSLLAAIIEQDPFSLMSQLSLDPRKPSRSSSLLAPSQISPFPSIAIGIGSVRKTSPVGITSLHHQQSHQQSHTCSNKEKKTHTCPKSGDICVHPCGTNKPSIVKVEGTCTEKGVCEKSKKKAEKGKEFFPSKSKWKTGEQISKEKTNKRLSQSVVVNTKHTNDSYDIYVCCPKESTKEDIALKYKNNKIMATVQLKENGKHYGEVVRHIHLPIGLLLNSIEAHYEEGCLKVVIPKDTKVEKQKTSINID